MEFPFGGRCFDLTHRAVVIGDVGSAHGDQRAGDFVDRVTALVDLEPDGVCIDPAAWTPEAPNHGSIQELLSEVEHLKVSTVMRVRTSLDIDVALERGVAGLDLTSWQHRRTPDLAVKSQGPIVISSLQMTAPVGEVAAPSVVDIGPLDGADLPDRLSHVRALVDRGHVVCCRMPATPDPLSVTWGALVLALRRGVRLVITSDVTSTRRMAHVIARIEESGAAS